MNLEGNNKSNNRNKANRVKVNQDTPKTRVTTHLRRNVYLILTFLVIIFVSLFLRLKIYPILTADPTLALTGDSDSSSILRLFDLATHSFPKMPPMVDYYANYPWGFKPNVPPVWPYLLAVFSLPIAKVLSMDIHQTVGLLVVVLAMCAVIPIYFLARELFGKRVAIITAAIAPMHPFFIILSNTGVDHITADLFLVPSLFALFLVSKRYFQEGNYRRFVVYASLGGVTAALAMAMSLTMVLIVAIMMIPMTIAVFILSKENLKPVLAALGAQFGFATLVFFLVALVTTWFSRSLEFSHLSYLHIAVFGAIALFGAVNYLVLRTGIKQPTYRLAAGIIMFFAIAAALSIPHLREIILGGYYRSIGSYPLGRTTFELTSLYELGKDPLFLYYSYFIVVVPITVIYLAIKDIKQRKTGFEQLFFYVTILALGFYTTQALYYYSPYFSILAVIAYGLSISLGASLIHDKLKSKKYGYLNYRVMATIGTVIVIAVMVFTTINIPPRAIDNNLTDLVDYIKTHTDKPGDFYNPTRKPSYSIIYRWGYAPQVQYLSQRAMVSSANHEIGITGIIASDRFYQATSENKALDIIKDLSVRYVIASGPYALWVGDISKIGEAGPAPDKVARFLGGDELNTNDLEKIMATRLMLNKASPQEGPLHHFRLVFASINDRGNQPLLLYEAVKGCRIIIKAAPNSSISISAPAVYNNRRFIAWQDFGKTDEKGIFSTLVPYSSETIDSPILVEPYKIQSGYREYTLEIPERAVIKGETINFGLNPSNNSQ